MQQEPSSATAKAEPPPPPAPVFFPLDTFTVNLGDADRVLYVGITLRLKDEATRSRLNDYLPEVRSRLLLLFSRQDASTLPPMTVSRSWSMPLNKRWPRRW
jgi:flagellar FliL protein